MWLHSGSRRDDDVQRIVTKSQIVPAQLEASQPIRMGKFPRRRRAGAGRRRRGSGPVGRFRLEL
jgi:hypothetical protein